MQFRSGLYEDKEFIASLKMIRRFGFESLVITLLFWSTPSFEPLTYNFVCKACRGVPPG